MLRRQIAKALVSLPILLILISCQTMEVSPDYSDPSSWAYYAEGDDEDVDLFLVCPTVDMGEEGNLNMSLDDEETKAAFVGALNMERGIYEDTAVMYAPFYRQMTFPVYEARIAEDGEHLRIAYSDIEEAFTYYMENINDGRPFMLAGFSQGAQLVLMLLERHLSDPGLQERLVAAYCIGWKVTEDDLDRYPHLKMAAREDDTGVIISFNTEAEGIQDSIIVPAGVRTLSINPLSWRTDSAIADRSLNKGGCLTDYAGNVVEEIPFMTGAYIDPERGTLRAVDIDPAAYENGLFPSGVYHLYDYQFFFRNLEENVAARADAWLEGGN